MGQMRSVFGAPAGTPLNQFVRGGRWVPDVPQNAGVPTAPPIRLAQLAGATNYVPISISGPTSLLMPPHVSTVSGTYTVSGGQGSLTPTWTKNSNSGQEIDINNIHTLTPVFSRSQNNVEGTATWTLSVTDGITTATLGLTTVGASSN
jgi:hypothetical protein